MISTLLADPDPIRPTPTGSPVRVSRPPRLDPPFDEELTGSDEADRGDRTTPTASRSGEPALVADRTPPPPARGPNSPSSRAAMAFVCLCIEVLNGFRPRSHLRRLGDAIEFGDVIDQIRRRRNTRGYVTAGNSQEQSGRGRFDRKPVRSANSGGHFRQLPGAQLSNAHLSSAHLSSAQLPAAPRDRRNQSPAQLPVGLIRLRVSEPLDGVAEAVAVLSHGDSTLAMALRLERRAGTWICALMQVI